MYFNFAKRLWPSRTINRCSSRRPRPTRLNLEHLEDRLVPSTTPYDYNPISPPSGNSPPLNQPDPSWDTPAQIRQAYGFNQIPSFWKASTNTLEAPDGTGQTIAIVSACQDLNIAKDLNIFDQRFGLTSANLTVYDQCLTSYPFSPDAPPSTADSSDAEVAAAEVEWAHAMAPGANILLVEANSDSETDYFSAAQWAGGQPKVSVVLMGAGEAASGSSLDSYLNNSSIAYVAAAGDYGVGNNYSGQTLCPAASNNVLGVGGTDLQMDGSGNYIGETVWNGSDGGQNGTSKQGPDVGYNAVNYAYYNSCNGTGWSQGDGTQFGAAQWASLIAIADEGRAAGSRYGLLNTSSQWNVNQLQYLLQPQNLPSYDFHGLPSPFNSNGITGTNAVGDSASEVVGLGTPYANRIVGGLDGEFNITGTRFEIQPGQTYNGPVATFTYYGVLNPSTLANIDWSDGSMSSGTIVNEDNGQYEILGTHTYNSPGTYSIYVQLDGYTNVYMPEPITSTAGVSPYTPNQLFVEGLYQDFLGRAPDPAGWAYWVGQLNAGLSRQVIAADFARSSAALGRDVNGIFEAYLGRAADPGALSYYVPLLQNGQTLEDVESQILAGQEFWQDNGSNNNGFVTALYEDVLRRSPNAIDASEVQGWVNALNAGASRYEVASAFVNSNEFRTDALKAMYGGYGDSFQPFIPDLLKRYQVSSTADSGGLSYYLSQFNSGMDLLSIEIEFAACSEYYDVARS